MRHGITDAKRRNHQRTGTADTRQHHKHPDLIPKHIPERRLSEKGQPLPDRSAVLKKDPPSGLRRLRTNQRCRSLPQHPRAGCQGSEANGKSRDKKRHNGQFFVKYITEPDKVVKCGICRPESPWQEISPDEKASRPSENCSAQRIPHVLAHDSSFRVAESLERSDLATFLLHHTEYGRHAYQKCNHDKKQRKDIRDRVNNRGVVLKAHISRVFITSEHIYLGLLNGTSDILRRRHLFSGCSGFLPCCLLRCH